MKLLRNLAQRWKQWRCEHWWRPAICREGPAKYCEDCGQVLIITEAEFYSVFGKMPHIL